MDRIQLFDTLSTLPPATFERLLFAVNMPPMNRAGAAAKIGEQVSALLEWAESIGPGIDVIENYLGKVKSDNSPTAFDFSEYLQFICRDPKYKDVRDLYTETEVLIPLEAETVEERSPTEASNPSKERTPQKVEPFAMLKGLRHYALGDQRQHRLLAGGPSSGRSTTVSRV